MQLDIFRQIKDQLDEQRQIVQTEVLETLVQKLNHADARLRGLCKTQSLKLDSNSLQGKPLSKRERANYAMQKSSLDKAIHEVEVWQRLSFDPLWFATMKAQTSYLDEELRHVKESNQCQGNEMIAATMAVRNPLRDIGAARVFLSAEKLESAETAQIASVPSSWCKLTVGGASWT